MKESLCIQSTPTDSRFNRDGGYELPSLQVNDRKSICLYGIRELVLYIWEYVTCAPHD